LYQVKKEIGLLKDAKTPKKEFQWKVDVADGKKYDAIRKQYDSYFREDQRTAMQKMRTKLIELVASLCLDSDNMVLDVATGMGSFILPLLEKVGEGALVIGTDIDEKPLRGTMNKAKNANTYSRLSLIVTDAKHLAFKKSSFSTISSYFGLDNVPEASLAFVECARILRSGGKLVFLSLWLKENSESMKLAGKHHVGEIASETRINKVLKKAGLLLDSVEDTYSDVWPNNPMDLLPVEGEEYSHVIVQARKPNH
jgi:ubiquinone/menaquinone biosynthesis C-methylase UbiE